MLLVPEVAGVTSFRIQRFYDAASALAFLGSLPPGAVSGVHAFWALDDRPAEGPTGGEAMVLIRSDQVSDLVYVVSFVDIESALSFARFEVKRGMSLGLLMVYWAELVTIGLAGDEIALTPDHPPASGNGRPRLVPPTAPHFEQQPAAFSEPAPSPDATADEQPEPLTAEPPAIEPEPIASFSPELIAEAAAGEERLLESLAAAEGPMAADQETDALAEGTDPADVPGPEPELVVAEGAALALEPGPVTFAEPEPANDVTVEVASEGQAGDEEPTSQPTAAVEEPLVPEQPADFFAESVDTATEAEPVAVADVPLDIEPEPLTFAEPEPANDVTIEVASEGEPGNEEPAPEPSAAVEEPPVLEQQSDVSGTELDTVTETELMASADVPLDTEPGPVSFAEPEPANDVTVEVADQHELEVEPISAEEPSESEVWDVQASEVVQDEEAPDTSTLEETAEEEAEEDGWAAELRTADDRPTEISDIQDPDLPSLADLVKALEDRDRFEAEAATTDDHQFGDESSAPVSAEAPEFLRDGAGGDDVDAAEEWRPGDKPSLDEDGSPPHAGAPNGSAPDTKPSPIPEPVFASNGTGPHEDPDEPPEQIPGEDGLSSEMAEFLKSRRRDSKEHPFRGFNSPPGRF